MWEAEQVGELQKLQCLNCWSRYWSYRVKKWLQLKCWKTRLTSLTNQCTWTNLDQVGNHNCCFRRSAGGVSKLETSFLPSIQQIRTSFFFQTLLRIHPRWLIDINFQRNQQSNGAKRIGSIGCILPSSYLLQSSLGPRYCGQIGWKATQGRLTPILVSKIL